MLTGSAILSSGRSEQRGQIRAWRRVSGSASTPRRSRLSGRHDCRNPESASCCPQENRSSGDVLHERLLAADASRIKRGRRRADRFTAQKCQATALKKCARQAPYGKGTETLVDTSVRRVWEIDADRVELTNPEWTSVVGHALRAAQSDLGLEKQKLEANLYKLLLYEPGCFFLAHRDGEKLDRMIGTLIIALPAFHEGGQLVIRHEGCEAIVDFGKESRFHTQFAAFYADCEHEIRPVTSGFRLALVYNLTLRGRSGRSQPREPASTPPRLPAFSRSGKRKLPDAAASDDEPLPSKLAVLLDHKYSPKGLTFDVLKGIDRVKANILFAAARESGYDASLALVTHWESGSAEPSEGAAYGRYGYRRGYGYDFDDDDDGEHEMGEVYDESLTAQHFSDCEGKPLPFGQLPLGKAEIISETPLNEGEPDQEDFEGYTGNAGMTLERWYHHAAVVLWPEESRFDVLCEAGVQAAVGGLEEMVNQWKQAPKSDQAAIKERCLEFADRIIAHWPEQKFGSGSVGGRDDIGEFEISGDEDAGDDDDDEYDDFGGDAGDDHPNDDDGHDEDSAKRQHSLLSLLATLRDATRVAAWIRNVLAKDASVDPGKLLLDICRQHGWSTFQDDLLNLFEDTSNETIERHVRLLADWSQCKDKNADRTRLCALLARSITSAFEHWSPRSAERDWRARDVNCSELLPLLSQSLITLGETELFERLTTHILDQPKHFDFTAVQIPALFQMETWLRRNLKGPFAPLHRWLAAVVAELESLRIASSAGTHRLGS